MCGIAGAVLDRANASSPVEAMVAEIRHRGPDEESFYSDRSLHMGFFRLSIVDSADGHQPVASEDGAIVALSNGEIYNHQLLRDQLSKDGHSFNSRSDAEVLPHAPHHQKALVCPYDGGRGFFGSRIVGPGCQCAADE